MSGLLRGIGSAYERYSNQNFETDPGESIILDAHGTRGPIGSRHGRLLLTNRRPVFKPWRKKPITIPPLVNTALPLSDIESVSLKPTRRLLPWVKEFTVQGRDSLLTFRTSEPERWIAELSALLEKRRRGDGPSQRA